MTLTVRAYDASLDVSDGERTVVATINTDGVDRYRTVIVPKGAVLEPYRKNPVVLANHDGCSLPVGRNLWIKVQKDRLIAKTQFLPAGEDEFADKVFRLYQLGFLKAWSVGFDPIDWGKPSPEEIRARPDWAEAEIIFRKWELLEYSAVTVPGNADALTEAVSRGLSLPGWPSASASRGPFPGNIPPGNVAPPPPNPGLPPLVGRTLEQVAEAMRSRARAEAQRDSGRLTRDALELARGMV